MDELQHRFTRATEEVQTLSARPGNAALLELYALFKQATAGDVHGARPGLLNMVARAKHDAWAAKKGMARDEAMQAYVDYVAALKGDA
jgi:acyl-CoA-binding protein